MRSELATEQSVEAEELIERALTELNLGDSAVDILWELYETGYAAGSQMEYSYPS